MFEFTAKNERAYVKRWLETYDSDDFKKIIWVNDADIFGKYAENYYLFQMSTLSPLTAYSSGKVCAGDYLDSDSVPRIRNVFAHDCRWGFNNDNEEAFEDGGIDYKQFDPMNQFGVLRESDATVTHINPKYALQHGMLSNVPLLYFIYLIKLC